MTGNAAFVLGGGLSQAQVEQIIEQKVGTPVQFKGTVGVGGTVTDLPNPAASAGWEYKVITDGSYSKDGSKYLKLYVVSNSDSTALQLTAVKSLHNDYSNPIYTKNENITLDGSSILIPDSENKEYEVTYATIGANKVLRLYAKTTGIRHNGTPIAENYEIDYKYIANNYVTNIWFTQDGTLISAKSGDIFISNGEEWVLIPSGDDTLPIASASTLGGVKVGSGLSIDASGVLAASGVESGSMIFKGFVGTVSQPDLPLASQANKGWMYIANDSGNYSTTAATYFKPESGATVRRNFYMIEYSDQECTQQIGSTLVEWMGQYSTNVEFPDKFVYHFNNGSYSTLDALTNLQVYNGTAWNSYTPGQSTNYQLTDIIKISGQITAHKDDHFVSTGTEWVRLPGGGDYPSTINNQLMGSVQTSSGFLPLREKVVYRTQLQGASKEFTTELPRFGASEHKIVLQICGIITTSDGSYSMPLNASHYDVLPEYATQWYSYAAVGTQGYIEVSAGHEFYDGYVTMFVKWIETN